MSRAVERGITHGQLRSIFKRYLRWVSEEKPKHGWDYTINKAGQYYYDPYRDSIRANDDGTFTFDIQTDDSPEGDTWWRGTFKLIEGLVSIIGQQAYIN